MRPLTAGVASGGLTGFLVSLAQETLRPPTLTELEHCLSPGYHFNLFGLELDLKSVLFGIFVGLFLGPVLEVICLARQLLGLYLRRLLVAPQVRRHNWKVLE